MLNGLLLCFVAQITVIGHSEGCNVAPWGQSSLRRVAQQHPGYLLLLRAVAAQNSNVVNVILLMGGVSTGALLLARSSFLLMLVPSHGRAFRLTKSWPHRPLHR